VGREEPKYRIPSDALVIEALRRVTATKHSVESQRHLRRLVAKELTGKENYRIGERRLRLLALDSGDVGLHTICRESDVRKTLLRCPVCGTKPKRLKNETVFGGTVTLGYRCPRCGYWTGLKTRIPTRYVFTRR